jgi:hypothetical protein
MGSFIMLTVMYAMCCIIHNTQYNQIQHNETQHNETQHYSKSNTTLNKISLSTVETFYCRVPSFGSLLALLTNFILGGSEWKFQTL